MAMLAGVKMIIFITETRVQHFIPEEVKQVTITFVDTLFL